MGKEVVYLICSIAKLEVRPTAPARCLPDAYKTRRSVYVGNLDAHQIIVFTGHAPEPSTSGISVTTVTKRQYHSLLCVAFLSAQRRSGRGLFFPDPEGDFADKNTVVLQPFQTLPAGVVVRLTASASACKERVQSCVVRPAAYGQFYLT